MCARSIENAKPALPELAYFKREVVPYTDVTLGLLTHASAPLFMVGGGMGRRVRPDSR